MDDQKAIRTITVTNPAGLHARPAELFARMALKYNARIEIIKDGQRSDAKSIWKILMLAAGVGTRLQLEAEGPDAHEALDALAALVESDFADGCNDYKG